MQSTLKALRTAWQTFLTRPIQAMLIVFLFLLLNVAGTLLLTLIIPRDGNGWKLLKSVLATALNFYLLAGLLNYHIKLVRKQKPGFGIFFNGNKMFELFVINLLLGLLQLIIMLPAYMFLYTFPDSTIPPYFFLASIFPFIWLMVRLSFSPIILLTDDVGILKSLRQSYRFTRSAFWRTLFFLFALIIVGLSGILLAGFGVLFTISITTTAYAVYYLQAEAGRV